MLVEDNISIRSSYKKFLEEEAAQEHTKAYVEEFSESDDAVKRLLNAGKPPFDLILTDIDLSGAPNHNKAGIDLAKFVKETQPDTPIVGCSGHFFGDKDLSEKEKQLFDRWWTKGSPVSKVKEMFKDTVKIAILHKEKRLQSSEAISSVHADTSPLESSIQSQTTDYRQEIIAPTEDNGFLEPFTVFVWESEDGCELEVMGCPALMSWGDDFPQAVEVLEELCEGYRALLDTPDELLSPNMREARDFLKKILNPQ
jgi:CheY-like chemotaxis protein